MTQQFKQTLEWDAIADAYLRIYQSALLNPVLALGASKR